MRVIVIPYFGLHCCRKKNEAHKNGGGDNGGAEVMVQYSIRV